MTEIGPVMEIIVYVSDMASQVAFYSGVLGLTVREPRDVADFGPVHWVEFETGQCTLALHAGGRSRLAEDAPRFVFQVSSVPGARERLQGLGVSVGEIRSPAPGVQVCDAVDPEGNRFSLESREENRLRIRWSRREQC